METNKDRSNIFEELKINESNININLCICGSSEMDKEFIESGSWLGSSNSMMRRYALDDNRFRTREYSLGFDFYANGDLLKTHCLKCGKNDFIKP